jgi:hypothetical protein
MSKSFAKTQILGHAGAEPHPGATTVPGTASDSAAENSAAVTCDEKDDLSSIF